MPQYKVRSTVFLKHRINWESVRSAVRSFTWSTILKSADPLVAFDRAIGEVLVGMFLPLFFVLDLKTSNGLMPAASEFMMLNRLLIVPGVEHAMRNIGVYLCMLARAEEQKVYGAARETHNERARNTRSTPPVYISGRRP